MSGSVRGQWAQRSEDLLSPESNISSIWIYMYVCYTHKLSLNKTPKKLVTLFASRERNWAAGKTSLLVNCLNFRLAQRIFNMDLNKIYMKKTNRKRMDSESVRSPCPCNCPALFKTNKPYLFKGVCIPELLLTLSYYTYIFLNHQPSWLIKPIWLIYFIGSFLCLPKIHFISGCSLQTHRIQPPLGLEVHAFPQDSSPGDNALEAKGPASTPGLPLTAA